MPVSHFVKRRGWDLFSGLCSTVALGGEESGAWEKLSFSHQSPNDMRNNSNLESITKINKDIAGESAARTQDGGAA